LSGHFDTAVSVDIVPIIPVLFTSYSVGPQCWPNVGPCAADLTVTSHVWSPRTIVNPLRIYAEKAMVCQVNI